MQSNSRSKRFAATLRRNRPLLSVFFTAGYPELNDALRIARGLEAGGADLIEIGIPFSDPVADGPVIQKSSAIALRNGMSLERLFDQLRSLREAVSIPVYLMGYANPVFQFGIERFAQAAREHGVDGAILPDLPLLDPRTGVSKAFADSELDLVGLVAPQTSDERVREIDEASTGFIYAVGGAGVTGKVSANAVDQEGYFERLSRLQLRNPILVGFGVRDRTTFKRATRHAAGAILGTAFIEHLARHGADPTKIKEFLTSLRDDA